MVIDGPFLVARGQAAELLATVNQALDAVAETVEHAIEGAVGKLEGVSQVKVDIPTRAVHIDYDPQKVTLAKIEEVLDDTGYTVAR